MNGPSFQRTTDFNGSRNREPAVLCGAPVDALFFDESRLAETPDRGKEEVLARFELPNQYCGVFENFSQFIGDQNFRPLEQFTTPGLEWQLRSNGRPLYPYIKRDHVVNPWGFSCCPVAIRLDENATVEFVVRNLNHDKTQPNAIVTVGGRITGRYWYNPAYGDVSVRGGRRA